MEEESDTPKPTTPPTAIIKFKSIDWNPAPQSTPRRLHHRRRKSSSLSPLKFSNIVNEDGMRRVDDEGQVSPKSKPATAGFMGGILEVVEEDEEDPGPAKRRCLRSSDVCHDERVADLREKNREVYAKTEKDEMDGEVPFTKERRTSTRGLAIRKKSVKVKPSVIYEWEWDELQGRKEKGKARHDSCMACGCLPAKCFCDAQEDADET